MDFLFFNRVELKTEEFDDLVVWFNLENIKWLVEHGYQGNDAIAKLERLESRNAEQLHVLNYLRDHPQWKADDNSPGISYGNYQGDPHPF